MAVTAVDARARPNGVLQFPSPSANLLFVEDSIEVDAADVVANAHKGLTEAVFFSFNNLHKVRDRRAD